MYTTSTTQDWLINEQANSLIMLNRNISRFGWYIHMSHPRQSINKDSMGSIVHAHHNSLSNYRLTVTVQTPVLSQT